MTELDPALQLTLLLLALPLAAFLCNILIGLGRRGTGEEERGGAGAEWWIGTVLGFAMLATAAVAAAMVLSRPETPLEPSYYPKAQAFFTLVDRGGGIASGSISVGIVAGNTSSLLLILVALIGLCSHLAAADDSRRCTPRTSVVFASPDDGEDGGVARRSVPLNVPDHTGHVRLSHGDGHGFAMRSLAKATGGSLPKDAAPNTSIHRGHRRGGGACEDAGSMRTGRVFSRAGNALLTFAAAGVIVSGDLLSTLAFLQLAAVAAWMMLRRCGEAGEERTAAGAAYITARAGDIAMLAGVGMLFARFGTVQIAALFDAVYTGKWGVGGAPWLTVAGLLLACGALARAGQVPWHAWLVRASTAPAAVAIPMHTTMAAIGIYLLARLLPILTVDALAVLRVAGTVTAVIGATSALAQQDVRRTLSYSTVALLGLLTVAIGLGRPDLSLLYFLPGAAAVACLFLGVNAAAKVVANGMEPGGEPGGGSAVSPFDIGMMGGLRRAMPLPFAAMTIAAAGVVGLPLTGTYLSGRFVVPMALGIESGSIGNWDWFSGLPVLLAVLLIGFTLFRLLFAIFLGIPQPEASRGAERRAGQGTGRWLLATLAALALWPAYSHSPMMAFKDWQLGAMFAAGGHVAPTPERWLMRSQLEDYSRIVTRAVALPAVAPPAAGGGPCYRTPGNFAWQSFGPHDILQCCVGVLAVAAAALAYLRRRRRGDRAGETGRLQRFLLNGWYLDAAAVRYVARFTASLAKAAAWFDANLLDGVSNAAASLAARSARGLARFDLLVVDGMLNLAAGTAQFLGLVVRQAQSGRVQIYLLYAAIGIIALFFLFR
ncbi:MAG: hypothetical protein JST22_15615 [Bacteroidetes bacterium]|nr:hypothetical protein [Bacteroidota bacterium]